MKYLDLGCNIDCWKCTRECRLKELMEKVLFLLDTPECTIEVEFQKKKYYLNYNNAEKFFDYYVMETLKPNAGIIISKGIDPKVVQEELKYLAVSLFVAKKKYIETHRKK